MRHFLLTVVLLFAGRSSMAQEIHGRDLAPESDQPSWRTQIVVKISRSCRRRFCVKVVRYEEQVAPRQVERRPGRAREEDPPPADGRVPLGADRDERVERVDPLPQPINASRRAAALECGTADESRALALLNAYRLSAHLTRLACDRQALRVARAHSQDMCDRRYFSHYTPEGKAPWDRLRAGGVSFRAAGENIAQGYDTPQGVHDGWVASDGHRANMLNASWTRAAVGLVDCQGGRYWTQLFAR
jgi:uncharacterized protein YkwD